MKPNVKYLQILAKIKDAFRELFYLKKEYFTRCYKIY